MKEYNDPLPERDEIADETDMEVLLEWHAESVDLLDSLKSQLTAAKLVGNINPDYEAWAFRAGAKAGYAGTTLRRIERRIVTLGGELPLTVDREERDTIGRLKRRVSILEYLLRKNGIDPKEMTDDF